MGKERIRRKAVGALSVWFSLQTHKVLSGFVGGR